jgi:molecular chaperone HscB
MQNVTSCWNCGKSVEEVHFCEACRSLQPPATNYYDFFGLEHKLNLDLEDLEKRFYTLSRRLHPDVYFRRSEQERQYSLDASAILNDGYRVLRNPVTRAEYLLAEEGFDSAGRKSQNVPPELLEEVFDLNESLEEFRQGDESVRPQVEAAERHLFEKREEIDRELESKFEEYDRTKSRDILMEIQGLLNKRQYIRNLIEEIEKELVG